MGDSQLVVKQLIEEYKCNNPKLLDYLKSANTLLEQFADIVIMQVPQNSNEIANDLGQRASSFKLSIFEINQVETREHQLIKEKD